MPRQDYINKDVAKDIDCLFKHADIANKEMGEVKEHLSALETDVKWVKLALEKVDTRTWLILGTIILGIVVQILFKLG